MASFFASPLKMGLGVGKPLSGYVVYFVVVLWTERAYGAER